MNNELDKWENISCPIEYLPLIIPLWEKYELCFYDLSLRMDTTKGYILYFSLEGSEDDMRLYTNEFHVNRDYYLHKIREMVCSAPETPDIVGEIEKAKVLEELYKNPPKRPKYDAKTHKFIFQIAK